MALLSAVLNGCGGFNYSEVKDDDLVEVSYDAVCELKDRLTRTIPKNSLIVVSTLLNVDNLNKTSAFGRIVSDQIASAFHQSGYQIIGMEMPIDLFVMNEDGKIKLSDEHKAMLKHYQAAVIVGGVYAPGKKNSYVSLRVVDLNTKYAISSTDFSIAMGPDAKKLMEPKEVGSAGSRSPATAVAEGSAPSTDATETAKPEEQLEPIDNSLQ
ncbi:MAG: FlgO family outer membrane protein [Methylococcaceae bacterium]